MRDYGIITPAFWLGQTGKQLRGDLEAQLLAVYLMTSPHSTMTGVFHCPVLYMAHETGIPLEGASKALARLIDAGFCEFEEATETVFVVQMARYQIAEYLKPGDKRIAGLKKDIEKMGSSLMRSRFIATYSVAFRLEKQEGDRSPLEAPSKPGTGTGTGTGTRSGTETEAPSQKTEIVDNSVDPVFVFLENQGIKFLNPDDPEFTRLKSEGADFGYWQHAASIAVGSSNLKFSYVLGIVRNQLAKAKQSSATVPPVKGIDPALAKLNADKAITKPPNESMRIELAAIKAKTWQERQQKTMNQGSAHAAQ